MDNTANSSDLPQDSTELCRKQEPLKQFPTARYFQVHFEFLQEQIQLMKDTQAVMLMQMSQLEQRLLTQEQQLFSDDQHPFAARHSSMVSSPAERQVNLRAGIKNTKKG